MQNFLFSDFYLSLLFNFTIGLSLGFFCLLPSMLIIILIICITKTACFDNIILMEKLEGKVAESKWTLYAHKFPNSGYFNKIFWRAAS